MSEPNSEPQATTADIIAALADAVLERLDKLIEQNDLVIEQNQAIIKLLSVEEPEQELPKTVKLADGREVPVMTLQRR